MFKELFSTELFSEITFNLNGDILIVKVKDENGRKTNYRNSSGS